MNKILLFLLIGCGSSTYETVPSFMIEGIEFIDRCAEFCHPDRAQAQWRANEKICICTIEQNHDNVETPEENLK